MEQLKAPNAKSKQKLAAVTLVLLSLLLVPAPLLPPHFLSESVQSILGIGWKAAYLVAALGLHLGFYSAVGALASLAVNRAPTWRQRWLQMAVMPLAVVAMAVIIRSVKLGHVPMLANAIIPIAGCLFGVVLGLSLLYRGWKATLVVAVTLIAAVLWNFLGGASADLSRRTETRLRQMVARGPGLPSGPGRFGALVQAAFASSTGEGRGGSVQNNRAAILALGIAIGHERLARFVGLDARGELVRAASELRKGATLRGRDDWPRHYTLSAALAALENPLTSDASGLLKEELDALTHGSGFSFGDLAADRAGIRFAMTSTGSEASATAMQARLQSGFVEDDFFPRVSDFPENLTVEQFRRDYGGVGSPRYRQKVRDIDGRIELCPALSAQ